MRKAEVNVESLETAYGHSYLSRLLPDTMPD